MKCIQEVVSKLKEGIVSTPVKVATAIPKAMGRRAVAVLKAPKTAVKVATLGLVG